MLHISKRNARRIILAAIVLIALVFLVFANDQVNSLYLKVKSVIAPFALGATLAFIFNVPMRAIERRLNCIRRFGLKRTTAITLTFAIIIAVVALLSYLLVEQVLRELVNLSVQLDKPYLREWADKIKELENMTAEDVMNMLSNEMGNSITSVLNGTFSVLGAFANGVINFVISVVFCVYCLFQKEKLARQGKKLLYALASEKHADETVRILRLTNSTFSNFLSGQCIEVCILGSLFALVMVALGMPYFLLISLIVAVTAFIPIVGAWVGCIVGGILILLTGDTGQAILFIIVSLVVQQFENNVIYPRVVGTSIGLSGMWVLVAVAVGGAMMGVVGMVLMIPIASVIQTLLREFTHKRLDKRNISQEKLELQEPERCIRVKPIRVKKQDENPDNKS